MRNNTERRWGVPEYLKYIYQFFSGLLTKYISTFYFQSSRYSKLIVVLVFSIDKGRYVK